MTGPRSLSQSPFLLAMKLNPSRPACRGVEFTDALPSFLVSRLSLIQP